VNRRFIDWIWHIRGSLPLPEGQSAGEAFDRLDLLFRERDTSHARNGDTLTFRKTNQAPQDRMAIYDSGVLQIERGAAGSVLRYDLVSRALLYCFLAPLFFLAFAQLTVAIGILDKPSAEELAAEKKKAEEEEEKKAARPLHPIDQFLGAPAPEKPKKDDEKDKEKSKEEEESKGPSPTPAYVFAGIFAALYIGGRILEDRLIRSVFRKRLTDAPRPAPERPLAQ
jgi:hypothetical protein